MKESVVVPEILSGEILCTIKEVCTEHYGDGHNTSAITSDKFQQDLMERIMKIEIKIPSRRYHGGLSLNG